MPRTISLKEIQATYSVSVDKAHPVDEPVYIEHDGKPWAVLVPVTQYEQLVAQHSEILKRDDAAWCHAQLAHLGAERETFQQLLPELLKTHADKFVAIKGNQVVDSDADESALAQRTREHGVRPIFIERVTTTPTIIELPSQQKRGEQNEYRKCGIDV